MRFESFAVRNSKNWKWKYNKKPSDWNTRNKYYYVFGRHERAENDVYMVKHGGNEMGKRTHHIPQCECLAYLALHHTLTRSQSHTEREHAKEEAMKWNELNGPFFRSFILSSSFISFIIILVLEFFSPSSSSSSPSSSSSSPYVFILLFFMVRSFVYSFACLSSWLTHTHARTYTQNNEEREILLQNAAVQFTISLSLSTLFTLSLYTQHDVFVDVAHGTHIVAEKPTKIMKLMRDNCSEAGSWCRHCSTFARS